MTSSGATFGAIRIEADRLSAGRTPAGALR